MPHNRAVDAQPDAHETQPADEEPSAPPGRRGLKRVGYGWRITIGVLIYLVIAFFTVLYAPAALLNNWITGNDTAEKAKVIAAAGNLVLLALGGVIAVVTVGLSMSRHRQEREAAERDRQRLIDDQARERARQREVDAQRRIDTERALRERFVTTVKLLSDPAPVNRQAALFALGALADDWDAFGKPDEVQVCIEVLTAYLRAPRTDDMLVPLTQEEHDQLEPAKRRDAQRTIAQEVSVKQAGYTVIRNHLADDAAPHWRDRLIDLTYVHIDFPLHLTGATVSDGGTVDLTGVKIRRGGTVVIAAAMISDRGTVDLTNATIVGGGTVDLTGTMVVGRGTVDLTGATIIWSGTVNLDAATIVGGGTVDLTDATISDGGTVNLANATISDGGTVDLTDTTISDGGTVLITDAVINYRGTVDLTDTTISDGGTVDLTDTIFSDGGTVVLTDATTIREGGLRGYEGWRWVRGVR